MKDEIKSKEEDVGLYCGSTQIADMRDIRRCVCGESDIVNVVVRKRLDFLLLFTVWRQMLCDGYTESFNIKTAKTYVYGVRDVYCFCQIANEKADMKRKICLYYDKYKYLYLRGCILNL